MLELLAIGKPFIPVWAELRAFVPELWLVGTIVAVLIVPMLTRRSNAASGLVALIGLAVALLSALVLGLTPSAGDYLRGLLVLDSVALLWKCLLLLFVIGIVLMWFGTTAETMHEGDGPEFFTLLLGATLGMCLMASTANLLMIVMSVEMASLPSYVLAGFRKTHRLGAEASLKYVLFGAATSSIMVYGLSMLYGMYGTLQLDGPTGIAAQMAAGPAPAMLVVSIFGLLAGIGFKISAVPFHFWCPDVFEGASIEISAFLSVASKGAALVLLLRVLMGMAAAAMYGPALPMTTIALVIGVMGAVTATVGNTAAYVQMNIKRLLAYSSIAHAGYMLCAISLLVKSASAQAAFDPAATAAQAILLYLAVYLFMNLGAFAVAGVIYRQTGSESLQDYAGLRRRSPLLALCMLLCLLSLIGLPPVAGFWAKVNLLWALFQNGSWWWVLIAVIVINTVLSAFYYFRIVRMMYLTGSDAPAFVGHPVGMAVSLFCAGMLLLMFVGFGPLLGITAGHDHLYGLRPTAPPVAAPSPQAVVWSAPPPTASAPQR